MPIDTNFAFNHKVATQAAKAVAVEDLLGPLRGFVGHHQQRSWRGKGFNLIWRPNFGNTSGSQDFFLELNLTDREVGIY